VVVLALLGAVSVILRHFFEPVAQNAGLGVAAVLFVGAVIAAGTWIGARKRAGTGGEIASELQHAEVLIEAQRSQHEAWETARRDARARAEGLGLPPDAEELRLLATRRSDWDQSKLRLGNPENILA
jgi:hypothetical protein